MEKVPRKPVGNFLLKRSLQARIIARILMTMLLSGILISGILAWYYTQKSKAGYYYYMSNDARQDLELKNILGVILPSLIVAQTAGFCIALAIGLFSSRKVAVPLYKIERWAQQLSKGNLKTRLMFREKNEMKDIVLACNAVSDFYRELLSDIDRDVRAVDNDIYDSPRVRASIDSLKRSLDKAVYSP